MDAPAPKPLRPASVVAPTVATLLFACSFLVDTDKLASDRTGASDAAADAPPSGTDAAPVRDGAADAPVLSDAPIEAGPRRCTGLATPLDTCGAGGTEDCCESPLVPGEVFYRGHDGVQNFDTAHPAQVDSFRLDRFEVTVARFRPFVAAVVAGYRPPAGSGKHAHVGAAGVAASTAGDGGNPNELGWQSQWDVLLPGDELAWATRLGCQASFDTWSIAPGDQENFPINCVDWIEAYAFCIWDGGFLPTETESMFAGMGGAEQRVFPWSVPPTSTTQDCSYQNITGCADGIANVLRVGSTSPKGDGRWGHADLGGNMREWALDVFVPTYGNPCINCATLSGGTEHATHAGGFFNPAAGSLNAQRASASDREPAVGIRCARAP